VSGVWLTDAVKVLRKAGVQAKGVGDWKKRSASGGGYPDLRFVLWHHDASPAGSSPGALSWMVANGPAANMWVDINGVWHVYCAGVSWHAGTGGPGWGVPKDKMNYYGLGIETDHTTGEPWPKVQLDSLRRGTAALMKHYGLPADRLLFHYTWTNGGVDGVPRLPTYGRKNDPDGLNLKRERRRVGRLMKSDQKGIKALLDRWFKPTK
jgi:hypothetical protein